VRIKLRDIHTALPVLLERPMGRHQPAGIPLRNHHLSFARHRFALPAQQLGRGVERVTVTDLNTHFVQGTTTADFGSGIIVNSVVVTSAVSMTANISIAGNAVVGARTVTVTTGTEVASLD
jgi:hypothetical protein